MIPLQLYNPPPCSIVVLFSIVQLLMSALQLYNPPPEPTISRGCPAILALIKQSLIMALQLCNPPPFPLTKLFSIVHPIICPLQLYNPPPSPMQSESPVSFSSIIQFLIVPSQPYKPPPLDFESLFEIIHSSIKPSQSYSPPPSIFTLLPYITLSDCCFCSISINSSTVITISGKGSRENSKSLQNTILTFMSRKGNY